MSGSLVSITGWIICGGEPLSSIDCQCRGRRCSGRVEVDFVAEQQRGTTTSKPAQPSRADGKEVDPRRVSTPTSLSNLTGYPRKHGHEQRRPRHRQNVRKAGTLSIVSRPEGGRFVPVPRRQPDPALESATYARYRGQSRE